MKNLSISKKRMKRAVRLASIAAGMACASQELVAGPTFGPATGIWTVNGSAVTATGISSSAYFAGTASVYNVTVTAGSSLTTTSNNYVIGLAQGNVSNAGTISISGAGTVSGIYFQNKPTSGNVSVTNTGTVTASSGTNSAYGVLVQKSLGNATVINSGTMIASGGGGLAASVYIHDTTGPTATVINSGTLVAGNSAGQAAGIYLLNLPATGNVYANVTNTGTISAYSATTVAAGVLFQDRDATVGTGSAYATLVNSGTITASSPSTTSLYVAGVACSRPQVLTITNSGTIQASAPNAPAYGVYITPFTKPGVGTFATTNATITNSGTISGTSVNSVGYGIYDNSTNLLSVNNTGTLSGSTTGILSTTGSTNLTLNGGTLAGYNGNAASINTGTVNVVGRAQLIAGAGNPALLATGPTGQLNLNLVGGTPAQLAQAQAAAGSTSGSFVFGGYTYSWSNFNVSLQATSLELVCAPQYSDLASKIDTTALPMGYGIFYNAALNNPNAALNALSGFTVIEGMQDLEVNSQNTLSSTMENQLESLDGLGGFNANNLTIGSSVLPGVNSANNQLTHLATYADQKMNDNTSNTVVDTTTADAKDDKEMAPSSNGEKWSVWLAGGVTLAHEDHITGAPGYSAVNGSPMLGFDYTFTPDYKAGLFAGATIDGANFGDGSRVDANTELVGMYGSWHHGPWFVDGFVAGGPSQYNDKRTTFGGPTTASPDGYAIDMQTTMGYTFKINQNFNITPELGVQYTHLGIDKYSESGGGIFATNVNAQDIDSFRSHLGGKMDGNFDITSDLKLIPELRAAWYHEYLTDTRGVGTSLAGAPGFNFNVNTLDPDRDYALFGIGLNSIYTGIPNLPMGWFINYDVQAGQSDYLEHNVTGGMRISF